MIKDYCLRCSEKSCTKTGKPCREVENYLQRKPKDRLYCDKTIYRHEIPVPPSTLDYIGIKAIERLRGRRKNNKNYGNE